MKSKVLGFLKRADNYVSGEEISKRLGVSRTAVWKHIRSLKEDGYKIESQPNRGYSLKQSPNLMLPTEIKPYLETRFLGFDIIYQARVTSTNIIARELAEKGASSGTLVLAEEQAGGKGRLGRVWASPPGGIWLSFIVKPEVSPFQAPLFTLLTAAALGEVLKDNGFKVGIKWPNDILCEGKKVVGILTEVRAEIERLNYLVIGVGINANISSIDLPQELREQAATLQDILGIPINRPAFVAAFLKKWEELYFLSLEEGFAETLNIWRRNNITLGRELTIKIGGKEIRGKAIDIDEKGALIILKKDGTKESFLAGEVTLSK